MVLVRVEAVVIGPAQCFGSMACELGLDASLFVYGLNNSGLAGSHLDQVLDVLSGQGEMVRNVGAGCVAVLGGCGVNGCCIHGVVSVVGVGCGERL